MTRRLIIAFLLVLLSSILFNTLPVQAAEQEFKLNVSFVRQNDGTTSGELWYNDHVIWRVTLLADGAGMVTGQTERNTTFIAPDMSNGFFLLKIYNQP
jgi:hypothetical protein